MSSRERTKLFDWSKTSASDFEGLCYELLSRMGFHDITWRRGSATNITSADQGRDLEATFNVIEPDGSKRDEKWFVECKGVSKTLGQRDLQSPIDWARAERPDVVLVITSSFLSNGAREWLDKFIERDRPAFRIKVWERSRLESLLTQHLSVRQIEDFGLIPSSTNLLFKQALEDWQNHLLSASPDRLEVFFNDYESLDLDDAGRCFLLFSELRLNPYEPERDWFSTIDGPTQCAVLVTMCIQSIPTLI